MFYFLRLALSVLRTLIRPVFVSNQDFKVSYLIITRRINRFVKLGFRPKSFFLFVRTRMQVPFPDDKNIVIF